MMSSPSGEEIMLFGAGFCTDSATFCSQIDFHKTDMFVYRDVTNMPPHTVMFPETNDSNQGCSSQALNLTNADFIITYGRYSKFLKFSV